MFSIKSFYFTILFHPLGWMRIYSEKMIFNEKNFGHDFYSVTFDSVYCLPKNNLFIPHFSEFFIPEKIVVERDEDGWFFYEIYTPVRICLLFCAGWWMGSVTCSGAGVVKMMIWQTDSGTHSKQWINRLKNNSWFFQFIFISLFSP